MGHYLKRLEKALDHKDPKACLEHVIEDFPELDPSAVKHIKKAIERLSEGEKVDVVTIVGEALDLFP